MKKVICPRQKVDLLLLVLSVLWLSSFSLFSQQVVPSLLAKGASGACQKAVEDRLARMSLEEQVGQLIMPVVYPSQDPRKVKEAETMLRHIHAGGILFQKGKAYDQYRMTRQLQALQAIDYLVAADNEWGLYMRLKDAIRYPRNWGLGQSDSLSLVEAYGKSVAQQCKLMGIHVSFAPVLDVNNNPRNPVIGTRSFASDPHRVARMGVAYARGMESEGILAVAKHFPGHGNTSKDSHKTLPTVKGSRRSLEAVELVPFKAFIQGGYGGIMTAHLSVPAFDRRGVPASQSIAITTGLLQEKLGFRGLVFTDGLAMAGAKIASGVSIGVASLLAGNDILLGPVDPIKTHREVVEAVRKGILSEERIKESCRKVLQTKWVLLGERLKAPEGSQLAESEFYQQLHSEDFCAVADKLWRASITTMKNEDALGSPDKSKKPQIGVLHLSKSGNSRAQDTFVATLREVGVEPVATYSIATQRGLPTLATLSRQFASCEWLLVNAYDSQSSQAKALVAELSKRHRLIFSLFASPFSYGEWQRSLSHAKGIYLAHESCEESARALVAKLFDLESTFSIVYPKSRPKKRDNPENNAPKQEKPIASRQVGFEKRFDEVDAIAEEGLRIGAYPGCQIAVIYKGKLVYNKAFGKLSYSTDAPAVTDTTLYDVASITKSVATAPLIMKLVEEKKLALDAPVGRYLPELRGGDIAKATLRELLLHESGLPATINFYEQFVDREKLRDGRLFYYRAGEGLRQIDRSMWVPQDIPFLAEYLSPSQCNGFTYRFSSDYYVRDDFSREVLKALKEQKLPRRKKRKYSDVGYILLGLIAEKVSGKPLDQLIDITLTKPLALRYFLYNPLAHFPQQQIAPTQENNFLRGKIWGLVDDENAACLGGVAGNAGIFANAFDLAKVGLLLLDKGWWGEHAVLNENVVMTFRQSTGKDGRRSLGFVVGYPQNPNIPSMASRATFGHTGFTGTSMWVDPVKDLVFVFLSNRTYPTRDNRKLQQSNIRPRLMEAFYKAL